MDQEPVIEPVAQPEPEPMAVSRESLVETNIRTDYVPKCKFV